MTTTTTNELGEEIRKAIGAHGQWKSRLQSAIATGESDFHPATIRKDNHCDFGRFLHQRLSPAERASDFGQRTIDLHAKFHLEAGRILEMALEGKKLDAQKAMMLGSQYVELSARLVLTLMEWRKALRG